MTKGTLVSALSIPALPPASPRPLPSGLQTYAAGSKIEPGPAHLSLSADSADAEPEYGRPSNKLPLPHRRRKSHTEERLPSPERVNPPRVGTGKSEREAAPTHRSLCLPETPPGACRSRAPPAFPAGSREYRCGGCG